MWTTTARSDSRITSGSGLEPAASSSVRSGADAAAQASGEAAHRDGSNTAPSRVMHQRKDGVLGSIESISRECRNYAGSFVILWHNSTLISSEDRRLYAEILEISAP